MRLINNKTKLYVLLLSLMTLSLLLTTTSATIVREQGVGLIVKSLQRKIVLNPGFTDIEDYVIFTNVGSEAVDAILVKLPKHVADIKVYDTISFLDFEIIGEEDGKTLLNIYPRFSLKQNTSTSFTIAYRLSSSYLKPEGSVLIPIADDIKSQYPYQVKSIKLIIYTPETTTSISELNPQPFMVEKGWRYRLVYVFEQLPTSKTISFKVSYTVYATIPKPVILASAIAIGLASFLAYKKARKRIEKKILVKKPLALAAKVSELAKLVDKWFSLQAEIVKTEEEYRLGKISKREYTSRSEVLKKDLEDVHSNIEDKVSKLSKEIKTHAEVLQEVISALKDLKSDYSKLEEASRQYAIRQITRAQYEKIKAQVFSKSSQLKTKLHKKLSEIEESLS